MNVSDSIPSAAMLFVFSLFIGLSATARAEDETTVPGTADKRADIVYATRPTGPVKLDLFLPAGKEPFPLVVWFHGGAWRMGDKAAWPHMNFMVAQQFAVANVEYRFSQVAPFPAQIEDCTAALDFLADHAQEYGIDPARIVVAGESAGGHLASMLGLTRSHAAKKPAHASVRAVIDLFGPTDLVALSANPKLDGDLKQFIGGPLSDHQPALKDASPINHVTKDAPPFLIFHGTADPLVPIDQSVTFVDALKQAGAAVQFEPVQDAGHAGPAFWTPAQRQKMIAFAKKAIE